MNMIHMNGDVLERQIRDLLGRIRETVTQWSSGRPVNSTPVHFRDLMICWDMKEYVVFDFKGVLPPELKYLADGRKRSY